MTVIKYKGNIWWHENIYGLYVHHTLYLKTNNRREGSNGHVSLKSPVRSSVLTRLNHRVPVETTLPLAVPSNG